MTVEVRIPTILRPYTSGEKLVTVEGTSLADVINNLESTYPGLGERLTDENGLRRFINIYINDEDVRFLSGLQSVISANDSITILPAVAGGV
jgi:molybdopterin converting factor small subunit